MCNTEEERSCGKELGTFNAKHKPPMPAGTHHGGNAKNGAENGAQLEQNAGGH